MLGRTDTASGIVDQDLVHLTKVNAADQVEAARRWFAARTKRVYQIGIYSEMEEITPIRAEYLLSRNAGNRSLAISVVKQLVGALRRGEWQVNGETLIISDTGELNDGQHRCQAVVQSGVTIQTMVCWGASRDSRKAVDQGTRRTAAHILGMAGNTEAASLAAAAKALSNLKSGNAVGTNRTAAEVEAVVEAHKALRGSVPFGRKVAQKFRQPSGPLTALHYLMAERDRKMANDFFTKIADGVGINSDDDPVARLRARLMLNLSNKAKLPPMEIIALVIKAWNAVREGRTVKALRWRTGGDSSEQFPQVM